MPPARLQLHQSPSTERGRGDRNMGLQCPRLGSSPCSDVLHFRCRPRQCQKRPRSQQIHRMLCCHRQKPSNPGHNRPIAKQCINSGPEAGRYCAFLSCPGVALLIAKATMALAHCPLNPSTLAAHATLLLTAPRELGLSLPQAECSTRAAIGCRGLSIVILIRCAPKWKLRDFPNDKASNMK